MRPERDPIPAGVVAKCYDVLPVAKRSAARRGRTDRSASPKGEAAGGRQRVGVRELRQNLSVHLRRVIDGAVLEVTERGKPVAVLGPLPEVATPLQRLILEGRIVQLPTRNLADLGPPLKIPLKVPLSKILDELREDRI